jgi:hypothetical protein
MVHSEKDAIHSVEGGWNIHGYGVTLEACECMDFVDRRLPCKHIYAAALASNIALPFSYSEYVSAKSQGIEIVFEFPTRS